MVRILLIDDDNNVRTIVRLTLTRFGHTVVEAINGAEGMRLLQEVRADLVIVDIVMPEKDGLEVLMELRSVEPRVKVIAISGGGRYSASDYLKTATLMGATKVLAKPFTNEALTAAIDEVLSGGGALSEPSVAS